MNSGLFGTPAVKQRLEILNRFVELGVIEFMKPSSIPGRNVVQYPVRIPAPGAPWKILDSKEVFPWLLGIADAYAATRPEDPATPKLVALMAGAQTPDPIPAGLIPGVDEYGRQLEP